MAVQAGAQQAPVLFSATDLKEDLSVFQAALTEAHPGLYTYHDSAYFAARFRAVEQELVRPMTEEAFFRLLNPLMAAIRCGHTKWHRDGKPDDLFAFHEKGLFPLRLYFREGKAYVLENYAGQHIPLAAEVVSINGQPMDTVARQLLDQVLADGLVQSARWRALGDRFAGYYVNFIGEQTRFKIGYKVNGGRTKVASMPGIELATLRARERLPVADSLRLFFPADSIASLRIPVFMPQAGGPSFEKFLDAAFTKIRQAGVGHLILDLRDNEGGLDRWGVQLYAWLTRKPFRYYDRLAVVSDRPLSFRRYASMPAEYDQLKAFIQQQGDHYLFTMHPNLGEQQPRPNPYEGKLYVLLNGLSFSVTTEFAAVVRDQGRGVFIGEESGGTMAGNNSGGFAIVRLPHTRLTLGIPLLSYQMHLEGKYAPGRGILPDHSVVPTVAEMLMKEDVVLEKTLELIRTQP